MTYRPSFERGEVWKPVQAIVPTAAIGAIVIGVVAGVHIAVLYSLPALVPQALSVGEFFAALWADPVLIAYAIGAIIMTIGMTLLVAILPTFFLVAATLMIFGLPAAWLLGRFVRHAASIPIALLAAGGAGYLIFGGPLPADQSSVWFTVTVTAIVLFTGLLYRHFVIAFRDEDELLA